MVEPCWPDRHVDDEVLLRCHLREAKIALHKLRIGQQAVEVEVDGRRVKYAHANIEELQAYVDTLRDRLDGRRPRFGAIGVLFG